jgi:hypothetical protein
MPDERRSTFPKWVPDAARLRFIYLHTLPDLTPLHHALLDRLASDLQMQQVWTKLPATAHGSEDRIVVLALGNALRAQAHRPPFPRRKKDQEAWLKKYRTTPTLNQVPTLASLLLAAIEATQSDAEFLWPANAELSFEQAQKYVKFVHDTYELVVQSAQNALKPNEPKIRKKSAVNAPQLFFSRCMSADFVDLFGEPLYEVVAVLTAVVFDIPDGTSGSTIRDRWRRAPQRDIRAKTRRNVPRE